MLRDAQNWIDSIPPVTRYLSITTVIFSLGSSFKIISPVQLMLIWPEVFNLQVWRLATCHLLSGGQDLIWHIIMLYQNSISLETNHFAVRPWDYLTTIIMIMGSLDLIAFAMGIPVMTQAFGMAITTLYSLIQGDAIVSFMFGLRFPAKFLPWVLLAFNVVMGGNLYE